MSKNYFTQETEDAIVAYNTSTDFEEKSKIYETKIHYAFFKLTQNIIHTFKLEYIFRCNNGLELESEIHKHLKEFRPNNYREFFDITLLQSIEAVKFIGKNYT